LEENLATWQLLFDDANNENAEEDFCFILTVTLIISGSRRASFHSHECLGFSRLCWLQGRKRRWSVGQFARQIEFVNLPEQPAVNLFL
jgi:hypothetical protein